MTKKTSITKKDLMNHLKTYKSLPRSELFDYVRFLRYEIVKRWLNRNYALSAKDYADTMKVVGEYFNVILKTT